MAFTPAIDPPVANGSGRHLYFLIRDGKIVVQPEGDCLRLPGASDIAGLGVDAGLARFIGLWHDHLCYTLELPEYLPLAGGLQIISLREAFTRFSAAEIQAISVATQLLTWDKTSRFCGQCGRATEELSGERAKLCRACGLTNHPRLSPSIIVSVIRDGRILLARSPRFPKHMYSVLAGFVEPGETLEQCVHREVREEVGIEVANIRYFGSQNWPFPHSLMIGFTAEYLSGEISIDQEEIVAAGWFGARELPELPGRYSIARRLIDAFSGGAGEKC